jgi:hypothetical protein
MGELVRAGFKPRLSVFLPHLQLNLSYQLTVEANVDEKVVSPIFQTILDTNYFYFVRIFL